jgi:hypothetical protein
VNLESYLEAPARQTTTRVSSLSGGNARTYCAIIRSRDTNLGKGNLDSSIFEMSLRIYHHNVGDFVLADIRPAGVFWPAVNCPPKAVLSAKTITVLTTLLRFIFLLSIHTHSPPN